MGNHGDAAVVKIENVGGIAESEVTIPQGVSVLVGRNATNRTSFLRAIMAAVGSDDVSLKSDQDEGRVELSIGEDTFTRTFERRNGNLTFNGEPYMTDATLADLFAFLLETNEARRSIEHGGGLYDVFMRPVDTEEIETEIRRLRSDLRDIEERLASRDSLEQRLVALEEERAEVTDDIDRIENEIDAKHTEIDSLEADLREEEIDRNGIEAKFSELNSSREKLQETIDRLEVESESIAALREEAESLERELADGDGDVDDRIDSLEDDLNRVRDRLHAVESEMNRLSSLIQFNTEFIEDAPDHLFDRIDQQTSESGSVTDELVNPGKTVCWTCGTTVDQEHIRQTVDGLRELRSQKIEERNDLQRRIEDIEAERKELITNRVRHEKLEGTLEDVRDELQRRESRRVELSERRDRLRDSIAELEADIDDIETGEYAKAVELHKELTELEFDVQTLERERASVMEEIETVESELSALDTAETDRDRKRSRLGDLQSRIQDIERDVVANFNEQVAEVIDVLSYERIERVWLERLEDESAPRSLAATDHTFELHLVRQNDAGIVYEDRIEHLSESERDVIGVVFAVTGYLVYEVSESVPFMLVDSLEALDSERIGLLLDYLDGVARYLVVALLPGDAEAVNEEYPRITDI